MIRKLFQTCSKIWVRWWPLKSSCEATVLKCETSQTQKPFFDYFDQNINFFTGVQNTYLSDSVPVSYTKNQFWPSFGWEYGKYF